MLRQRLRRLIILMSWTTLGVSCISVATDSDPLSRDVTGVVEKASTAEPALNGEDSTSFQHALGAARRALSIMDRAGSRSFNDLLGQLNHSTISKPSPFSLSKPLSGEDKLMIFISSSMPKASVRRLADQAAACGAALVLRGPVDGNFTTTAAYLSEALGVNHTEKDSGTSPARTMIDPTLFTKFGVNVVPAFVLAPAGICLGPRCDKTPPEHARVDGDVTLDYALEHLTRVRPDFADTAQTFLDKLKRTP